MLELAFQPAADGGPLYRQLEAHLRGLIEARRLLPGERLPASRDLAERLALSRNTVNQAYQALVDAGWLRSHVGQGTFVARGGTGAPRARRAVRARSRVERALLAARARGGAAARPRGRGAARGAALRFPRRPQRSRCAARPRAAARLVARARPGPARASRTRTIRAATRRCARRSRARSPRAASPAAPTA